MALADEGAASEKLVGTTLQSRYRLNRLIGRGGMGAVYEAVQVPLNKRVAVKVMARQLAANEEALARFRREADVTSQLGHPHIVQVFDFGETGTGEPYLVMEYLEGEDLEQRLARVGRLSLAATVKVVKQVASALSATHARGIVHRDLKPANIFLQRLEEEDDFVKVVDFGVSKVHLATRRLTGEKVVLGTPSYMAREQADGRVDDIDRRTDEWSLACIAYEMLAGRPPFQGEDASAILQQIIHGKAPPVTGAAPELPAGLEYVLARALSKDQAERFPTVPAFVRALEAAAAGRSIPTDEITVTAPELLPLASEVVLPGGGATTTLSNAAAEVSRAAPGGTRAPLGLYLGAVVVAASAALVLVSMRAREPAGAAVAVPRPARARVSQPVPLPVAIPVTAVAPAPGPALPPAVGQAPRPPEEPAPANPPVLAHVPAAPPRLPPATSAHRPPPRAKLHLIQDL